MKRIISITIALCLIFASVLPVYADWGDSVSDRNNLSSITTDVHALITAFTGSVGTMYNSISEFLSWITPAGSFSTSHSITEVTLYEILDYIAWSLSGDGPNVYDTLQSIAQMVASLPSVDSHIGTSNTLLTSIKNALYNYSADILNYGTWSWSDASKYAHTQLLGNDPFGGSLWTGAYQVQWLDDNGAYSTRNYRWDYGSPIGNVVLMEDTINHNLLSSYLDFRSKFLNGYNNNLTTWEHSTNTQTAFTPTSLANGLYRFLAYIQSDTSALWYYGLNGYNTTTNLYRAGYTSGSRVPIDNYVNALSLADLARLYFSVDTQNQTRTYQHLFRMGNFSDSPTYLGSLWGWDPQTLTLRSQYNVTSLTDAVARGFEFLSKGTSRLAYVLANDEEIAARAAAKDDQNAVVNNFVASSGNASASPTDYASVSAASSDFQNNFDTGVSASGVWTAFSNNYEWFTQTTADNLDTSQNNTRAARYETPYLDNYYSEVMGFFENKKSDIKESPDFVTNYIEQFNAERAETVEDEQR